MTHVYLSKWSHCTLSQELPSSKWYCYTWKGFLLHFVLTHNDVRQMNWYSWMLILIACASFLVCSLPECITVQRSAQFLTGFALYKFSLSLFIIIRYVRMKVTTWRLRTSCTSPRHCSGSQNGSVNCFLFLSINTFRNPRLSKVAATITIALLLPLSFWIHSPGVRCFPDHESLCASKILCW